ncbi:MAG: hypothetical protein ACLRZ9_05730 [Eubacterium sp.]
MKFICSQNKEVFLRVDDIKKMQIERNKEIYNIVIYMHDGFDKFDTSYAMARYKTKDLAVFAMQQLADAMDEFEDFSIFVFEKEGSLRHKIKSVED